MRRALQKVVRVLCAAAPGPGARRARAPPALDAARRDDRLQTDASGPGVEPGWDRRAGVDSEHGVRGFT